MIEPYTFEVISPPQAAQRPRMTRRGKAYTPEATIAAETLVAVAYRGPVWDVPVYVDVDYYEDRQLVTIGAIQGEPSFLRGDIDNLVKTTMDGLEKGGAFGLWTDGKRRISGDRLVMEAHSAKWPRGY